MIKVHTYENEIIHKHEFDSYLSLEKWVNEKLETFKKVNAVLDEKKDKSFLRYKVQMEELLEKNKEKDDDDYLKCKKCSENDHEGIFCLCEERNIRIAKEQRARGESPWQLRLKLKNIKDNE